ncbi:MAG: pyridoxal-dependent decarboxylase, exosortase A system-associated, partial [Gammaproteobacteria bacterium]
MTRNKPRHGRLESICADQGELLINDVPLGRLADRVGRTPFYAYDRAALDERVAALRAALPARVSLHYAIKANPMPAVVAHMRGLVDGFDVASQREMLVALDSGMPPSEISFAGPAKQEHELRAAVAAGICINCESETELERIAAWAATLGVRARVALRVNPAFELKGSGMKMSGSPRQFGIDAERVPAAIVRLHDLGLVFEGLHIFCGSQNLNADSIIEANRLTVALAVELCGQAGSRPRFLNIGGGYGIPYFPGDEPLDVAAVGGALDETLDHHARALEGIEIVLELGRYLVGEAGYYVCRVSDIKVSQEHTFVMVDGGLHHHLANSGNFGQILRKNYPVVIGNRLDQPAQQTVSIVGPLCTPLDLVADRIDVPPVAIGDLVVVLQSGAYGYTASPQQFLSHPPPL